MSTITLNKDNAVKAYREADAAGKKLLANLLGKEILNVDPLETIKNFDDVCAAAGVNIADYGFYEDSTIEDNIRTHRRRLKLIAKVFNGDWKADTANTKQNKYYPWFRVVPDDTQQSGFGLSYYDYDYDRTSTYVGVRPYFKDGKTAAYVGQTFLSEYEDLARCENISE